MRVAGLMSGTSLDAIDVAVCEFAAQIDGTLTLRLLGYRETPFPATLRGQLLDCLQRSEMDLRTLSDINFELGEVFADAVQGTLRDLALHEENLGLIASHGQTLYHSSYDSDRRSTLQMGEPTVIAQRTGCTVIADFRSADVAAGGQGAPLVSYFDAAVLGDAERTRAVQNIGGMANVTFIPAGAGLRDVTAFDTGPGNALIDFGARHFSGGRCLYDVNGEMAMAGTPHSGLLNAALAHPYFSGPPPKTTGRETFGDTFAQNLINRADALSLSPEDTMATLTALTAKSIARAYRDFGPPHIQEVIVSGGGVRNTALMRQLEALLEGMDLRTPDELGFLPEAKEAVAFALLGYEAIHGHAANLPGCTGAQSPAILGTIVPGSNYRALMARVVADEMKQPGSQHYQQGEREPWHPIRSVRLLP